VGNLPRRSWGSGDDRRMASGGEQFVLTFGVVDIEFHWSTGDGNGKMSVAKLVEGHHEVRLAQEAPQWHGDDWVKLGFCALDIVKIHGKESNLHLSQIIVKAAFGCDSEKSL
jgi:hypothetical protein